MTKLFFKIADGDTDLITEFKGTEEEFLAMKDVFWKSWFKDGDWHRDGGPAILVDGDEEWYQHGKWHREDGPAVICSDGSSLWFLEGLEFQKFFDQFFPMINYIKDRYPGE